jgi:hypothetical protein
VQTKMRQTAPNNHNPQPKPHLQGNVGHSDVAVRPADAKDAQMNVTILNFRRLGFQSNGNRLDTATKRNGSASCRRCLPPSPLTHHLLNNLTSPSMPSLKTTAGASSTASSAGFFSVCFLALDIAGNVWCTISPTPGCQLRPAY